MPSPVVARRLEIYSLARTDPAGFLRFAPDRLRFHLGTSLADLAVPVEIASDARAIVGGAAAQIALLLATHHRFVPPDELDRLILREDYAGLPRVTPALGPAGGGPDLRAAAQLGAAIHPALSGGLTAAWMGRGGKGRSLVALWIELLRRGLSEMAECRGREETPLLVALALASETAAAEREVREALPGPPLDRYLGSAALSALWVAERTALSRAWRDAARAVEDPLLARIEAALCPASLLGGRSVVLGGGSIFYGCELPVGLAGVDELSARVAQGMDHDAAAADLAAMIERDEEASRRAETSIAHARLREALAAGVVAAEASGQEAKVAPLRELLAAPGALATAGADEGARKELAERIAAAQPAGEAAALLDRAARAVRGWRQKDPAGAFGVARDAARLEYALSAVALLADLALDRWCVAARRALSYRTGKEAEGGAEAEWQAGRLYRMSARPGPILRTTVEAPVAHLFADVKDFTRRTALLGQAAMAEFLRREFYVPILAAAKEHFGGMQHLADRGGVALNNLLGDAVTFSGRIEAMVALAQEIRRRFADYGARLAREISSAAVASRIEEIERMHAAPLAAAARARAGAQAALAAESPGTPRHASAQAEAARLGLEEARLAEEKTCALARARGEGLEAGIFVSHGAAPLVVIIDDEVFGRNRVAIADKINESARGTARAQAARARADAALAAERAARGLPALAHAWSVFVGQPLQIPVPPEPEDAARRAAKAGDLKAAMRALAAPVREAVEAAARQVGDPPGDIYNGGAALSEEALMAFLAAVEGERVIRRVEVERAQIPDPLRACWFYGLDPLSLVVCFRRDGRIGELFRRVGVAVFKGLGGVVVWELCENTGGPGALGDALGASWRNGGW